MRALPPCDPTSEIASAYEGWRNELDGAKQAVEDQRNQAATAASSKEQDEATRHASVRTPRSRSEMASSSQAITRSPKVSRQTKRARTGSSPPRRSFAASVVVHRDVSGSSAKRKRQPSDEDDDDDDDLRPNASASADDGEQDDDDDDVHSSVGGHCVPDDNGEGEAEDDTEAPQGESEAREQQREVVDAVPAGVVQRQRSRRHTQRPFVELPTMREIVHARRATSTGPRLPFFVGIVPNGWKPVPPRGPAAHLYLSSVSFQSCSPEDR